MANPLQCYVSKQKYPGSLMLYQTNLKMRNAEGHLVLCQSAWENSASDNGEAGPSTDITSILFVDFGTQQEQYFSSALDSAVLDIGTTNLHKEEN